MSVHHVAMLLGLFGVPIALLVVGHRFRRRELVTRRRFWGGALGHLAGAAVAMIAAMIAPESWASGDLARGAAGYWAMLLLPVAGAAIGTVRASRYLEK